jgi:hypothetical protein
MDPTLIYFVSGGQCVEFAFGDGAVGVRDSKEKAGPVLAFTHGEWRAFLVGVKDWSSRR